MQNLNYQLGDRSECKAKNMLYTFEWDTHKAQTNLRKHGISFNLATSVLRDPHALTIVDEDHSNTEERWVTIGYASNEQILVIIHTWKWIAADEVKIRIISARKADRGEIWNYQNVPR